MCQLVQTTMLPHHSRTKKSRKLEKKYRASLLTELRAGCHRSIAAVGVSDYGAEGVNNTYKAPQLSYQTLQAAHTHTQIHTLKAKHDFQNSQPCVCVCKWIFFPLGNASSEFLLANVCLSLTNEGHPGMMSRLHTAAVAASYRHFFFKKLFVSHPFF